METKKYTLITGVSKGIGYELAKLFAKDNKKLFIVARKEKDLLEIRNELMNKYNIEVLHIAVDLATEEGINRLLKKLKEENIIIDNLINNAGVGSFGYFDEIDEKKDLQLINLNIKAPTMLIKKILPEMKKRKEGGILNIASTAAFVGGPKMSTYYSSKAYMLTLSEAIYEEGKEFNIKVSCLCPGPVKTNFQKEAGIIKSEKAKKYLMDADVVAKKGYEGFKKNKAIIIPGFNNKMMIIGTKLLPRSIIRKIIFNTNK